jgi:hypothetical protein
MTDTQIKAKEYLDKHRIEEIIGDIINTVVHVQMDDPIIFMVFFYFNI